ncbi:hypothetical protein P9112_013789 [Eukaryota sp. TZLM1-RC]
MLFNHGGRTCFRRSYKVPDTLIQRPSLSPLKHLTLNLNQCYCNCNSNFSYSPSANPRRVLTKPNQPVSNNGNDNANSDLIIHVHDIIGASSTSSYQVIQMLGQGTFGQVVQCLRLQDKRHFAVKIIKNKHAYYKQALMEVRILQHLLEEDPHDEHHLIRMTEYFVHKNHLCIAFELLSVNLYELIKQNQFRGLSVSFIRVLLRQILVAMSILDQCHIIHCDLKPENILLVDATTPSVKVIDFGSSCYEDETAYSYIQSRFYRAPEVILGLPYNNCIDIWSLGCIAAELFLGLPLFPGVSQYSQLSRIIEMIGIPPDYMLIKAKNTRNFFHLDHSQGACHGGIRHKSVVRRGLTYEYEAKRPVPNPSSFQLKSEQDYYSEQRCPVPQSKRYFKFRYLPDIIHNYPLPSNSEDDSIVKNERNIFISFIEECLVVDPLKRISVQQALMHPFIMEGNFPALNTPVSFTRPLDSFHEERLRKYKQRMGIKSETSVGGNNGVLGRELGRDSGENLLGSSPSVSGRGFPKGFNLGPFL